MNGLNTLSESLEKLGVHPSKVQVYESKQVMQNGTISASQVPTVAIAQQVHLATPNNTYSSGNTIADLYLHRYIAHDCNAIACKQGCGGIGTTCVEH